MRISTAPTPFDAIPKEDRIAWLEQKPTDALLTALREHIQALDSWLVSGIDMTRTAESLAETYRVARAHRDAYAQLLDWITSAKTDIRRTSDAA